MKSKTLNIDQYKSFIISLLFHSLIILFIVFIQNMKFNDLNKENKSFKKYFETSYEIALQFEEENKDNKINAKFLFNNKQELRKNKKDISNSMNLSSKKIEFKKLLFQNHINITQLLKYQTQKIKTIKCF